MLEVRGAVLPAVGIFPERDRHAGKRLGAHQLTRNQTQWSAIVSIEHIYRHAESGRLDLAAIDGKNRIAEHEARDDVASAADAREVHVTLYLRVDVIEAVVSERTAGRKNGLQAGQVVIAGRLDSRLLEHRQILRARPEYGHLFLLGHLPEEIRARSHRRAIVEHDL